MPSRMVIVPNELAAQIYSAIDRELEKVPEAAPDREVFYRQLLAFYDENGYVPEFSLEKRSPLDDERCLLP